MAIGASGYSLRSRDAQAEDAHAIAEVHVASWRAAYVGLLPDAVLDGLSVAQRARHWQKVLVSAPLERVVVAEADGMLLGFAHVGPAHDNDADPTTGQLFTLYVRPDVWGTGVGLMLHDAALDRLVGDGCARALLWMLSTNARASRFYRRAGWSRDAKIRVQQFGGAVVIDHRFTRSLGSN